MLRREMLLTLCRSHDRASKDHGVGAASIDHHHLMGNSFVLRLGVVMGVASCAVAIACSSSTTSATPAATTSTAAAVAGAPDTRCAGKPVVVATQAACHTSDDGGAEHDHDAAAGSDTAEASEYGPTQYNSEADDDECKYHVKWESTNVARDVDVTFKVTATNRNDSTPVTAAKPYVEIFLDEKTPAPNTPAVTNEVSPGTYTIGPVRLDKPGNWNVRFHFNGDCADSEESPHGHVTFFVKVP